MCGRYYIDDETAGEIEKVIRRIGSGLSVRAGDIRPTNEAAVLSAGEGRLGASIMRWGFAGYDRKGVLINARCETAAKKRTFRESMAGKRCVIPASGFYEWDRFKKKAAFCRPSGGILYMAGLWRRQEDGEHFVILTTAANESVASVHERMPLLLEEKETQRWILDGGFAEAAAHKTPGPLKMIREYEQQTFFL